LAAPAPHRTPRVRGDRGPCRLNRPSSTRPSCAASPSPIACTTSRSAGRASRSLPRGLGPRRGTRPVRPEPKRTHPQPHHPTAPTAGRPPQRPRPSSRQADQPAARHPPAPP
jgi:hypothetical protein